MINRTISISTYRDFGTTGDTWGTISGLTTNNVIEHYTGQTTSNAYVAIIPILLTSTIDDIGFYNPLIESWLGGIFYNQGCKVTYDNKTYVCLSTHVSENTFNPFYWDVTPNNESTGYTVTYTGSTRIDEFRRYGKSNDDIDLYNPAWNTGFTQITYTSTGTAMRITGEREKLSGFDKQNLYDYDIWVSGKTGTTIHYSDIDNNNSIISYQTSGLTNLNSIDAPRVKLDFLIGVVSEPKINIDVFIDRGSNSSFDRHMRLGDVKSLIDLENYGNGYYKIKEV